MHNELYRYSPISGRAPFRWPGDARVAFYVGVNVEHFHVDRASTSMYPDTAGFIPDPLNFGWRDYGARVGFWRLCSALDEFGVRASALVNAEAAERYPQIIAAGRERGWVWVAHGRTNSTWHTDLTAEQERAELADIVGIVERATGTRPKGWLGPGLTETFRTPALLAELGLSYTLDWTSDDQPFELEIPGVLSVPYAVDHGDLPVLIGRGASGAEFRQTLIDHFDQLWADSVDSGRVMALALHPFVIGQPSRIRYLREALDHIVNHEQVWVTTSDAIAEHWLAEQVRH